MSCVVECYFNGVTHSGFERTILSKFLGALKDSQKTCIGGGNGIIR
ncbi:hypothetical protein [uncultured Gammaproteobacteria bacterium]|nr:hypothetical protein [uncultured Gammaproteobacteria bacterium]